MAFPSRNLHFYSKFMTDGRTAINCTSKAKQYGNGTKNQVHNQKEMNSLGISTKAYRKRRKEPEEYL